MNFYYVHSSAWLQRYVTGPGTAAVQALFHADGAIASAQLGYLDLLAALLKVEGVVPGDRETLARRAAKDWDAFVQVHLTGEVLTLAGDLLRRFPLGSGDAVHLASAGLIVRRFVEDADRLIFVTTVPALKDAARGTNLTVLDPEEEA